MDNTDIIERRVEVCTTCGGAKHITKYHTRFPKSLPSDAYQETCPKCGGEGTELESDKCYIPRLRVLARSFRAQKDYWETIAFVIANSHPGYCEFCIAFGPDAGACHGDDGRTGEERRAYCTKTMIDYAKNELVRRTGCCDE